MDRGGLNVGAGASLGERIIEMPIVAHPSAFDTFLADLRARTRHDINQAKSELLAGMREFSATAITAHCESMATMARAVEHSADSAAAAFERSFAEYHAELAKRDEAIASLQAELAAHRAELARIAAQPVLSRWWSEFKAMFRGRRA